MHKFLQANHEPIKLIAEHSVLPVHLLLASHAYSIAALVAALVVFAYVAATVCKARTSQETNNA